MRAAQEHVTIGQVIREAGRGLDATIERDVATDMRAETGEVPPRREQQLRRADRAASENEGTRADREVLPVTIDALCNVDLVPVGCIRRGSHGQ